jgi:uncharacterized membrane-anchored protein YitT (DUF2179 family)
VVGEYALILLGALLNAVSINVFLLPNDVIAGGVTGLAMIGELSLGIPFGLVLVALNVPLLILQWRLLGGVGAFIRTVTGIAALATFTQVLQPYLPEVTYDRLLVICYGGGLGGLGLALVFLGRGTTGGADILAKLCHRWFGWSFGRTLLLVNALAYGLAGLLYGPEPAMVALLLSFVMGRTLDAVLHGISSSRAVLIITELPNDVRQGITRNLGRGLTLVPATGGYSGRKKTLMYVVVPRADIQRLKLRVLERDPGAFITVLTPREAVGGFQLVHPQ